jgi:hypothetical protein
MNVTTHGHMNVTMHGHMNVTMHGHMNVKGNTSLYLLRSLESKQWLVYQQW